MLKHSLQHICLRYAFLFIGGRWLPFVFFTILVSEKQLWEQIMVSTFLQVFRNSLLVRRRDQRKQ